MSQTKEGGRKMVQTMTDKYGSYEGFQAHMRTQASKGGKRTMESGAKPKGYAISKTYSLDDPRHPVNCGRKGGTISKRGKRVNA